ncbi:hypothetical protein V8C44DRAFT_1825 [Trichoderma aethiopicum]
MSFALPILVVWCFDEFELRASSSLLQYWRSLSLSLFFLRLVCIERGSAHCLAFASCSTPLQASSELLSAFISRRWQLFCFLGVFGQIGQVGTCISKPMYSIQHVRHQKKQKKRDQTMAASEAFSEHDVPWICSRLLTNSFLGFLWTQCSGTLSKLGYKWGRIIRVQAFCYAYGTGRQGSFVSSILAFLHGVALGAQAQAKKDV